MKLNITIDQVLIGVTGFILGVFGNVVANWLSGSSLPILVIFGGLLVLVLLFRARYRQVYQIKISAPVTIRDENECERYARQGLVSCVSLFNPVKIPKEKQLSAATYRQAALEHNFTTLDFENSNFEPLIRAVTTHRCKLSHCWLISSKGGSDVFIEALVDYLRTVKGITCQFHYEDYLLSPERDDAETVKKTRDIVDQIFLEAKKDYQIDPDNMIADFTGGTRGMSTGLILACLDTSRDIQFIGTHYDEQAKPTGELLPMIFEFEPVLVNKPT